MRLWSLHPEYLDQKGLVALWREGLLAQAVLMGKTKGYTKHPQLQRFREQPDPVAAIAAYLEMVWWEAMERGYNFDSSRIAEVEVTRNDTFIPVTSGQMEFEKIHLLAKLQSRDPAAYKLLFNKGVEGKIRPHPLFQIVKGVIESWERT